MWHCITLCLSFYYPPPPVATDERVGTVFGCDACGSFHGSICLWFCPGLSVGPSAKMVQCTSR